ncbi:hypothetical protein JCM3775_001526 [Rhodotorula graminis]|uniref:SET domain-containing protein n=1 Tax=Rhodotorula graminis (strain WP1) TaxID=578459 RepID=A0A0P9ENP9_RHOGW|nr:uncharacterized protein RHOBADRAFT_45700 [Rhodotorula graminis WP1]KPV73744.1 hypothetical protein RHOBADRAFT_45700 [Rhodotorula graminis WP1]
MAAQGPAATATAFEMVDIPGKGNGLVATRNIKAGEQILAETPAFVVTPRECTEAGIAAAVAKLSLSDRDVFYSLALADHLVPLGPHLGRFKNNSMEVYDTAGGVFLVGSRFNHSCAPNVSRRWDTPAAKMRFVASFDIEQGTELEIAYAVLCAPRDQRQQMLQRLFGFKCTCRACTLTGDAQVKSDERRAKTEIIRDLVPKLIARPVKLVELAKQGLALIEEEGIVTGTASFAWDCFQAAAAYGDVESAKAWAVKNLELQEREAGVESSEYKQVSQLQHNPRLHGSWGVAGRVQAVPKP